MKISTMIIGVVLLIRVPAIAQERAAGGQLDVQLTGGISQVYLDESFPDHWLAGASSRLYFAKGVAIQPELLYMQFTHSRTFQDFNRLSFIPHLVYEFSSSSDRLRPYLIGGVGYSRQREKTGSGWLTRKQAVVQGGLGAKIFVAPRVYLAPEVRGGFRPLFQLSVGLGFVLNK